MVGRLLSFGKGPIFSGYVSFREGISVGLARYLMKKDEYEPGPKVLVICSLKLITEAIQVAVPAASFRKMMSQAMGILKWTYGRWKTEGVYPND